MYNIGLQDLPDKVCGIYKIDFPNGKIYIGQSNNIKRRMYEHNNIQKNQKQNYVAICDRAIIKYGKIQVITVLEECSESQLDEKEKFWIAYYHSDTKNIGYNIESGGKRDGYFFRQRKLSDSQILSIRQRRYNKERKKDVYQDYKENISWGGFEKIWLGVTFPQIGKEFLQPFVGKTRQQYSHEANVGLNNGRAKMTQEQIIQMRQEFENRDKSKSERSFLLQLSEKYHLSIAAIRNIVHYKSYREIEPVSTIPEVEKPGSSTTIGT